MHVYIHFTSTTTSLQWRRIKYHAYCNTHPTFSAAFVGHGGLGGWGCEAVLVLGLTWQFGVTVMTRPA